MARLSTAVQLERELAREVEAIKAKTGQSRSQVLNDLVAEALERRHRMELVAGTVSAAASTLFFTILAVLVA